MLKILLLFPILLNTISLVGQNPSFDSLKRKIQVAVLNKNRHAEADALERLARKQAEQGSIFEALHNVERAIKIFHSLGEKADAYTCYSTLFTVHQQLHNGDKILEYALPALQYAKAKRDTQLMLTMQNAVGVGYSQKKQHAKASAIYLDCIRLEKAQGSSTTYAYANASSSLLEEGKLKEGLGYARQTIQQAKEEKDTFALAIGFICKAYAYAKMGDGVAAEPAVRQLEALIPFLPEAVIDRDLALIKHLIFAAKGDFKQAYAHAIRYHQIDSTLASGERNAQFAALESVYRTKEKEVENAQLSARLARQKTWLAVILSILLLLGVGFFFQRKQFLTNTKLLSAEKELAETMRLRAMEEKANYQRELQDYTQLLLEKNRIVDTLKNDLNQQITTYAQSLAIKNEQTLQNFSAQIMETTILTEADWRNFRHKFEQVHEGFFEKILQIVPDATEAELRLIALTKLQLANDEIAAVLGILPESVTKTRYRLRKKLNDLDLGEVVRTI